MRARLALIVSGMVCEIREVKLSAKPVEMLMSSPKATVPILVLGDEQVIDESLDIMRWALCRHDPEAWLSREDRTLIEINDGPFKTHLDRYKYPARHTADPIEHRSAGMSILAELENRLSFGSNLCGEAMGITDAAIMPFVRQFAQTDRTWFDAQPLPKLGAWLDRHVTSPLFDRAMIRHLPWRPEDAPILFPLSETSEGMA
jgi:glutathione S-transferase